MLSHVASRQVALTLLECLRPTSLAIFHVYRREHEQELARRGYSLVVGTSQSSEEEEAKQVRHLAERLVDGIVLIRVGGSNAYLPQISDFNIPIVFVDRILKGYRADKVLVDNEEGACKAVSALIGEGHHRIGYLGGNPEVTTAEERYKGYCRAMKEAGLEIEQKYVRFGNPTLPLVIGLWKT